MGMRRVIMGRCMHLSSGGRDKASPGMRCHPLSVFLCSTPSSHGFSLMCHLVASLVKISIEYYSGSVEGQICGGLGSS